MCVDVTVSCLPSAQMGCFGNLVPGAQVLVKKARCGHTDPCLGWRSVCTCGFLKCMWEWMWFQQMEMFSLCVTCACDWLYLKMCMSEEGAWKWKSICGRHRWLTEGPCTPLPRPLPFLLCLLWVFIFSGSEVASQDQVCPWGVWRLLSWQRVLSDPWPLLLVYWLMHLVNIGTPHWFTASSWAPEGKMFSGPCLPGETISWRISTT